MRYQCRSGSETRNVVIEPVIELAKRRALRASARYERDLESGEIGNQRDSRHAGRLLAKLGGHGLAGVRPGNYIRAPVRVQSQELPLASKMIERQRFDPATHADLIRSGDDIEQSVR